MQNNLDWTEKFNQNEIAENAIDIVEDILKEIYEYKLNIFDKHNLNKDEISLILIYPIFKATNIFIDRLLIAKQNNELINNIVFPSAAEEENNYYENTYLAILNYYYNTSITYNLLNKISNILNQNYKSKLIKSENNATTVYKKIKTHKIIKIFIKNLLKMKYKIIFKILKPKVVTEKNPWQESVYPFWCSIKFVYHEFRDDKKKIDFKTRNIIKNLCKKVFLKNIENFNLELSSSEKELIADLYSKHVDYILPLSLIEGLNDRLIYYSKFLKNSKIKAIQCFTGLNYDDNFKIFSLIAKRKKANFILNSHGLNNYGYGNRGFHFNVHLKHADFYCTFGNYFDPKNYRYKKNEFKALNLGSTYFNSVRRWKKKKNNSKFIMLYPSGPLMQFKTDLQEISPEKNLLNRNNILIFIDKILKNYKSVELIYKPFPGTFSTDPIKIKLSNWIREGRIKMISEYNSSEFKLKDFYLKSDLVLWDSISTGFGECVASNVPVIVFNNKFEYLATSDRGKVVNDELTKCGIQFFEIESGLICFDKIFNNTDDKEKKTNALNMIIEDKINPVSIKKWKANYNRHFK